MTVAELRKFLEPLPDDMPVIHDCCSDYDKLPEPTVIDMVVVWDNVYSRDDREAERYVRFHANQHPDPPLKRVVKVLHFSGN